MSRTVLLVAGEVSGDMIAAGLVRAVRARAPDVRFVGIGGDELKAAGLELRRHVRDMAVMGLGEVLRRYGFFRRVFRETVELARALKPDLVVLVDYPGFNLRFAREARRLGLKVLYYVCPQVWAWHRSRIGLMAGVVDRLLAIFPFEPAVFEGTGLRVDFVGHPLADEAARARAEPPAPLPWNGEPRVALLPGSRRQEIHRILPLMWRAAGLLEKRHPGMSFILAAPSEQVAGLVRQGLAGLAGGPSRAEVVVGQTRQVLRQARAALVVSGTATIETALMECPQLVVYRTSWLTYAVGKRVVRVPHLGMVNLVAGRRLCPELIQHEATPEAMASALEPLLGDTPERAAMREGYREVIRALGEGGAADRAAGILLEEIG
ncbi:MAG TPA: lipid-A-disaccharide synthase [Kiritimatiellia bacterium]|nr:lipid-A-disaccharide synthase [Kiritimatiellia bacterium]HRZ11780.1 lipid-A-disaccharide synthase [Kiritimatiellia bacterium]HSA17413.1 lipid-A-disaccharide synthase [Kiritimatiellia bacterium]